MLSDLPSSMPNPHAAPTTDATAAASLPEVTRSPPFIIGVAGGTASGKTTVCDRIMGIMQDQSVVILSQVGTLGSVERGGTALPPARPERQYACFISWRCVDVTTLPPQRK